MADAIAPRLYSCHRCRNLVSRRDDIISKAYQISWTRTGRAFLFSHAMNITTGPQKDRRLISGIYRVADVCCSDCGELLGWEYKKAYEESQKHKEGKIVLAKFKIVEES